MAGAGWGWRWLAGAVLAFGVGLQAQTVRTDPDSWTRIEWQVAQRDFYGLTALAQDSAARRALQADADLRAVQQRHQQALGEALAACKDVACLDAAMRWSDGDIGTVRAALERLQATSGAMQAFVRRDLRGSGRFVLYEKETDSDLAGSMWDDAARAMNRIVAVYGDGVPPHYAAIDRMRYDSSSPLYRETVRAIAAMVAQEDGPRQPFFFAEMKYAVMLLASNGRLDAGRFEPLSRNENAAAIARVKTIAWRSYPYSVIVVPGEGPDQPDVELSPLGRIRVELAVRQFRQGKAPFLLVSGGTVHPMLTRFDEAMEMRKELMTQWGVPASAILVDPYARHTTTNLRNAVREVIRYGIPAREPMLIVTDQAQAAMILRPAFDVRCMTEMHLRPWTSLRALSATEIEMSPNRDSLQEDAMDPMDP